MISSDKLYETLLEEYGTPPWWSDDPFTVVFQSVLVQNTSWRNVVKTTEAMGAVPSPEEIIAMDLEALEDLIRPCGFFRAKSKTIRTLTEWFGKSGFRRRTPGTMPPGIKEWSARLLP